MQQTGWGKRFAYALVASIFLVFTVFVVAPLEIVAANSADLIFGVSAVAPPLCIAALAAAVVLALVLSPFKGKAHAIAIAVVVALGTAAWLQALLLNKGLPLADGEPIDWSNYDKMMLVSSTFWVCVIGIAVALALRFPKRMRVLACAVAIAVTFVQAVGLASAASSSDKAISGDSYIYATERGLFDVSSKSNVIMFIIDASDYYVVNDALAIEPSLFDKMSGFTWFEDTTGSMIPTRYALPALLTGVHPNDPDEDFPDFVYGMYDDGSFMQDLNDTGYGVGVYSPNATWTYQLMERFADWTINYRPIDDVTSEQMDQLGTVAVLARCGMYRDLPWPLKRFVWYYTDELNSRMVKTGSEFSGDVPFLIDDPLFASKLREHGLSLNEETTGSFRLIHLLGSHYPYVMDRNGNDVRPDWTSIEEQTIGTFTVLGEYFDELRRLGVYDEATIIVTADHGIWNPISEYLTVPPNPVLFVKPRQSAEEASKPLVRSEMPASHWDLQATILEAAGAPDEVVALHGTTVWDAPKGRERLFYMTNALEWEGDIVEYRIDGDSRDISTWHPTGRRWPEWVEK